MNLIAFQTTIAVTGTAQQLPNNPVLRSVTIAARSTNTGVIVLGNAPSVTSSTGFVLEKGQIVTLGLPGGNTAALYAVGSAGDVFSVVGT